MLDSKAHPSLHIGRRWCAPLPPWDVQLHWLQGELDMAAPQQCCPTIQEVGDGAGVSGGDGSGGNLDHGAG